MKETRATIRLYSVSDFGYFPMKGQEGAAKKADLAAFGTLDYTLRDLKEWSSRLTLGNTATSEPREGHLHVYCKGIAKSGNDWVLSLVQEVPTSAGGVLQFDLASKVGAVKASSTAVGDGNVAGWATHYWILPAEKMVATIKLDPSPPSRGKMLHYVRGFMARYADCVQAQADGSLLCVSPRKAALACKVKFNLDLGRDAAMEQRILAGQVARVILREKVPTFLPRKKSSKTGFLSMFAPMLQQAAHPKLQEGVEEARVEVRIAKKLTREQTQALIDGWHHEVDAWANLGFEVKTEDGKETLWLERQRSVAHVDIRVRHDGQGVVDLESLAEALHRSRAAILASFRSTI